MWRTDRQTNQPTHRRTDKAGCRVACTRLKIKPGESSAVRIIGRENHLPRASSVANIIHRVHHLPSASSAERIICRRNHLPEEIANDWQLLSNDSMPRKKNGEYANDITGSISRQSEWLLLTHHASRQAGNRFFFWVWQRVFVYVHVWRYVCEKWG